MHIGRDWAVDDEREGRNKYIEIDEFRFMWNHSQTK